MTFVYASFWNKDPPKAISRLRKANKEEAFWSKKCNKATFGIKHPFRKRRLHPLIPITCNLSTILDFKVLNMILNNYYYFTTSTKNRGKCRKKKIFKYKAQQDNYFFFKYPLHEVCIKHSSHLSQCITIDYIENSYNHSHRLL